MPAHVLMVSYLFPPAGGVGVQRALNYAKYLPRHCNLFVLTTRNVAAPVVDRDLLLQVPEEVKVCRVFTPEVPYDLRDGIFKTFFYGSRRDPSPNEEHTSAPSPRRGLANAAQRIFSPDPQVVWRPFALRKAISIVRRHSIDTVLVTAPPFSALRIGVELKRRFPQLRLIHEFRDEWVGYFS